MSVRATLANMREHYSRNPAYPPQPFVLSPQTWERYSANPGDYFAMREGDCLRDREGNEMILAREHTIIVHADTLEEV